MSFTWTPERLAQALRDGGIELPQLEARWILEKQDRFPNLKIEELVKRRRDGEPLAYLLEEKGFYKDVFIVKPGVLIPRPETELLVEKGMEFLKSLKDPMIFDFGCGSGCIGLSLLKEIPRARLFGFDLNEVAVEVSEKNAKELNLSARARFFRESIHGLASRFSETADLIVANPPYISEGDPLVEKGVHKYEPHNALYAGRDGLDEILLWTKEALRMLKPKGALVMEFGRGQDEKVKEHLESLGFLKISLHKDLAGIIRAVSAQKGD